MILSSCSIRRTLRTGALRSLEPNQVGFIENKLDENSVKSDSVFVKKLNGSLYSNGKKTQFKGRIYSVSNDEMLIILSAKIGIEAFRIWMDKDEIQIMDHINKKIYLSDFNKISKRVGYEVDLGRVQNILFGSNVNFDIPSLHELKQNAKPVGTNYFYKMEKDNFTWSKIVDGSSHRISALEFTKDGNIELSCVYGYKNDVDFPKSISINLFDAIKDIQNIEFEYQKVSFAFKSKRMKPKNKKYEIVKL